MRPNFRVVDSEREHARDLAKLAVKQFRLDREKDKPLPVSNQSTGATNLFVNEVLRRTERDVPEITIRPRYRVNPLVALLLFAFGVIGLVMLAISIW